MATWRWLEFADIQPPLGEKPSDVSGLMLSRLISPNLCRDGEHCFGCWIQVQDIWVLVAEMLQESIVFVFEIPLFTEFWISFRGLAEARSLAGGNGEHVELLFPSVMLAGCGGKVVIVTRSW